MGVYIARIEVGRKDPAEPREPRNGSCPPLRGRRATFAHVGAHSRRATQLPPCNRPRHVATRWPTAGACQSGRRPAGHGSSPAGYERRRPREQPRSGREFYLCVRSFGSHSCMTKHTSWNRAAANLVARLGADKRNARILAAPWPRAAHSMVQGWGIRLSRPPATGKAQPAPRPTWRVFAQRATAVAQTRATHAQRSDWHLWATRRVSGGSRYIPKRNRQR